MKTFLTNKKACPPERMFGSRRGITLIEILIVLAGMGILFAIIVPQFSQIRENQVLKTAVADVLSTVDKARSQTLASKDSSEYGVHFQSDKVIIFKGIIFSDIDPNNVITDIILPANISNVTLGGISDVSGDMYFNRIYGAPNTNGTITISSPSSSRIITIYQSGSVSAN